MISFKEFLLESSSMGTYSGMRLSLQTKELISKFLEDNNIPNAVPDEKLHTTILFSRIHCPEYVPLGKISPAIVAKPVALEVWDTRNGKRALVLRLESEQLIARHKELMSAHNASYDYAEYKPHITLSYDVGSTFKASDFTTPDFNLEFNVEYFEPLNLSWNSLS